MSMNWNVCARMLTTETIRSRTSAPPLPARLGNLVNFDDQSFISSTPDDSCSHGASLAACSRSAQAGSGRPQPGRPHRGAGLMNTRPRAESHHRDTQLTCNVYGVSDLPCRSFHTPTRPVLTDRDQRFLPDPDCLRARAIGCGSDYTLATVKLTWVSQPEYTGCGRARWRRASPAIPGSRGPVPAVPVRRAGAAGTEPVGASAPGNGRAARPVRWLVSGVRESTKSTPTTAAISARQEYRRPRSAPFRLRPRRTPTETRPAARTLRATT